MSLFRDSNRIELIRTSFLFEEDREKLSICQLKKGDFLRDPRESAKAPLLFRLSFMRDGNLPARDVGLKGEAATE